MTEGRLNDGSARTPSFAHGEQLHSYLHPEIKPNSEITDESRDRVLDIIEAHYRFRVQAQPGEDATKAEQIGFARKLRAEGPTAAAIILEAIETYKVDKHNGTDYLIYCAGKENVPQIIDFMINNRHIRADSLRFTLQRLADESDLPKLVDYLGDSQTNPFYDEAAEIVLNVAYSAEHRSVPDNKGIWAKLISDLEAKTDNLGGRYFTESKLDTMRRQAAPDLVDMRYANEFFSYLPDPDLAYPPEAAQNEFAVDRLEAIRNLFVVAEQTVTQVNGHSPARVYERLAYREADASSPYAPTLGIEIEIDENSLIRTLDNDQPTDFQERADLAYAHQAHLRLANAAGMRSPRETTPGVIWEFASQPAGYYETLAREVQLLMATEAINPGYHEHPLHLTIGGISTNGSDGGAYLLARCLEAVGWCCSGKRLRGPIEGGEEAFLTSWTCKGGGGLKERDPDEVAGGGVAVELRTLSLQSLSGLERTLRSAYALGAALKAHQTNGTLDETQQKLADTWRQFSLNVALIFNSVDLDLPNEAWKTEATEDGQGSLTGQLDDRFIRLSEILDEASSQPDGRAGRFQAEVQSAIIEARSGVMAILAESGQT